MELEWDVEISHIYREENLCADMITKSGINMQERYISFEECPPHWKHFLEIDCSSLGVLRSVGLNYLY